MGLHCHVDIVMNHLSHTYTVHTGSVFPNSNVGTIPSKPKSGTCKRVSLMNAAAIHCPKVLSQVYRDNYLSNGKRFDRQQVAYSVEVSN